MFENGTWDRIWKGMSNFPPNYPEEKLLKYSTHIPLLFSFMDIFKHDSILEFGAGLFSTPIFYDNYIKSFVTVEDNQKWLEFVLEEFPSKEGFKVNGPGFIFKRGNRSKEFTFSELSPEQKAKILKYYRKVYRKCNDIDLLFIDQIKYGRGITIEKFYDKANVILFHDCQHIKRFGYDVVNDILKHNQHDLYVYKTVPSYTGMLVKKGVKFSCDALIDKIKFFEDKYFKMISRRNKNLTGNVNDLVCRFEQQKKLGNF